MPGRLSRSLYSPLSSVSIESNSSNPLPSSYSLAPSARFCEFSSLFVVSGCNSERSGYLSSFWLKIRDAARFPPPPTLISGVLRPISLYIPPLPSVATGSNSSKSLRDSFLAPVPRFLVFYTLDLLISGCSSASSISSGAYSAWACLWR